MEMETINTRVLIIDDEELVRDNMEEILVPKYSKQNQAIANASSILFDGDEEEEILLPVMNQSIPVFIVDKAINGMNGLEKVVRSLEENKPYAVIFLDMRMPGWDGLETAMHIREVDIKAEIIIVTAFSDRSIDEIIAKAGQNVGYHCKPYASEEILQLATKGISDYNKLRNLEKLISVISSISLSEKHLGSLLQNILDQLAMYIGSDTALLGKLLPNKEYQILFSNGSRDKEINIKKLARIISSAPFNEEEVEQIDEVVFVKLDGYTIFALLNINHQLKTEKLYLLKLFVQNAAKAIKNLQLYEQLIQKEKLSAVGNAMGMLMHDLRTPIKNIPVLTALIREDGVESEFLDMIDTCGEQASEIFDDFLDFIRETPLKLQLVSIEQLIADGITLSKNRPESEGIPLHSEIEPGLFIKGDFSKLKRVIMNVLNNAADVLKERKIAHPTINISAKKQGRSVVITIRDNGPGIPAEIIGNLFEAFVTAQKSNGTGLGLAIVKQYVLAHDGTIEVRNDKGALFTIKLPLAD